MCAYPISSVKKLISSFCHETPCEGLPDPGHPLPKHLPSPSIEHTNRLMEEAQRPVLVQMKKQVSYKMMMREQWVVGKYAAKYSSSMPFLQRL